MPTVFAVSTPKGYQGTSGTPNTIGTGTKTFTVDADLAYSVGARIRTSSNGSPSNWMEGTVTSYSGTTLVAAMDTPNGSGTYSDWNLNVAGSQGAAGPAGPTGPAGPPGPGYQATSTDSVSIGTGSKSFTVQAGLAYSAGARARAASSASPTNWMEGAVTSYSGTTLTLNVDATNGSGSYSSWNINLSGAQGAQGPIGPPGSGTTVAVQDEGSNITPARSVLNFVGAGVTAADDAAGSRTTITIPGGGGMTDPTTTKGDLIVHGTTTTRLGVGGDGMVLTADAAQTLGVKWAVAAGTPAGSSGQVQYNNAGAFGASSNLFWDSANNRLGLGTTSPQALIHAVIAGGNVPPSLTYNSPANYILNAGAVDLAMGLSNISPYPFWIQARLNTNTAMGISLQPLGGNVGIANTNPLYKLDITGDCNISGVYRVNGTPISTGGGGVTTQTTYLSPTRKVDGTAYQNTTGKPMLVAVSVQITNGTIAAFTDSTSNPTTQVNNATNASTSTGNVNVTFWVLPGNYYKIAGSGGSLGVWTEWY